MGAKLAWASSCWSAERRTRLTWCWAWWNRRCNRNCFRYRYRNWMGYFHRHRRRYYHHLPHHHHRHRHPLHRHHHRLVAGLCTCCRSCRWSSEASTRWNRNHRLWAIRYCSDRDRSHLWIERVVSKKHRWSSRRVNHDFEHRARVNLYIFSIYIYL